MESLPVPGQLGNATVAHAEMNALGQVPVAPETLNDAACAVAGLVNRYPKAFLTQTISSPRPVMPAPMIAIGFIVFILDVRSVA